MRVRGVVALVLCVGLSAVACAQDKDAEKAFASSVKGKTLLLRGFPYAPVVHWTVNGESAVMGDTPVHAMDAIRVSSAKFHGNRLVIAGDREFLLKDQQDKAGWMDPKEQTELDVDFADGEVDRHLPGLVSSLFFPGLDEATAALPEDYRKDLPASAKPKPRVAPSPSEQTCKPPRIVHSVDPEVTEDARRDKVKTAVQLGFTIELDGKPDRFWIVRPSTDGLNESALTAARQYVFTPAVCDGKPKAVHMNVDINYSVD